MNTEHMTELYNRVSKHSQYQTCGEFVAKRPHYERERLNFLLENLDVRGKNILDIGGNTGWFSLELLSRGAEHVSLWEGNQAHAEFARETAGHDERLEVHAEYYDFDEADTRTYDLVLLLNVLHHTGDDYGGRIPDAEAAKKEILRQLIHIADRTQYIFFQLGFNWKGNINSPLFKRGTKSEMISFVEDGVKGFCDVVSTGIAERNSEGVVKYCQPNAENIRRDDSLGEFLNRPIFLLKKPSK